MRRIKLTREERQIEDEISRGEWRDVSKEEFDRIARIVALRRKDAVLNIRINSQDLKNIKLKAKKLGIKPDDISRIIRDSRKRHGT